MPSSWKLFIVLRRPLTLNEPSRPLVPTPFWFDSSTPVDSSARLEYDRPFSGRLTICCRSMTWPRSLESVSSSWTPDVTRTRSVTVPTCNVRSTRWRALTATPTSLATVVEKPWQLGHHLVGADAHVQELVVPVLVGHRRRRDAGRAVGEGDRRAGNDGAGPVFHRPEDDRGFELGIAGRSAQDHENEQRRPDAVPRICETSWVHALSCKWPGPGCSGPEPKRER